ncbi:MAG: hypothetical protein NTW19_01125 [Planctomycetota bacterium]|nr:hypothetical protein [Planctomycetota bacterium]
MAQARAGQPQKAYRTSWGQLIDGLYRGSDLRWRVVATGQRFREPDERLAIMKFKNLQPEATVAIPAMVPGPVSIDQIVDPVTSADQPGAIATPAQMEAWLDQVTSQIGEQPGEIHVQASLFWAWLREQLISRPEAVGKLTGIPELANLRHLPALKAGIPLKLLAKQYLDKSAGTKTSRCRAVAIFQRLVKHTGATTVNDLTQEKLIAFRDSIEASDTLRSAGTRKAYYGRIKAVIAFGLKEGMDEIQIGNALKRCKVLWTAEASPPVDPTPISRVDFIRLLAAGNGSWRAWLLLGLNLCMTIEDLCELRWAHFNLEAGTYAAYRVKTKKRRIPRAGTLWPESITALKVQPRKTEFVFVSPHGTRYSNHGRGESFAELRKKAGLPDSVKFCHIRDGAYTAAIQGTTEEKWARVLAGHRAPGLQDNYVLRNAEATRPACEAVYKVYGPFGRESAEA